MEFLVKAWSSNFLDDFVRFGHFDYIFLEFFQGFLWIAQRGLGIAF